MLHSWKIQVYRCMAYSGVCGGGRGQTNLAAHQVPRDWILWDLKVPDGAPDGAGWGNESDQEKKSCHKVHEGDLFDTFCLGTCRAVVDP